MMRDKATQYLVLLKIIKNCKVCVCVSFLSQNDLCYLLFNDWCFDILIARLQLEIWSRCDVCGRRAFLLLYSVFNSFNILFTPLLPLSPDKNKLMHPAQISCQCLWALKWSSVWQNTLPLTRHIPSEHVWMLGFPPLTIQNFQQSLNSFLLLSSLKGNCTDKVSVHQKNGVAVALLFPGQLLRKRAASPLRSY